MAGVHYSNKLEDQAASTALNSHKEQRRPSVLDEDGKLSSASAAMSLKYAQAQDLPSFPSAGLKMSSAGAAASLADSNKKSFEHWKPAAIPAANRAALLAKDYEMDPLWQPEMSAAGSKAALLAHKDTESPEIWKAQGTSAGQSAAGQAIKSKPPGAITEREVPADSRQKALMAATGAMSGNRPRAGSTPVNKGDSSNWALKAATQSHKGVPNSGPFASGDPGFEAARIQNIAKNNVNRQMYGSKPPVALEVEEKNRQDMLRASAVAMAKKMYAIQQTHIDEASGVRKGDSRAAANSSHRRTMSDASSTAGDDLSTTQTPRYENLEEAARKLAQERLAKLHDEHAEYRQYYGASTQQPRSRLSMRIRPRRNSTGSREDSSSDDEAQARRVKKQMSIFQSKLADVDKKKQQADRDALLAVAHRNVEARMSKLDDKIFQETGKASPAQRDLWEQQAREKAQLASDERMQHAGKVHIGGGKYLEQSEVDAIAKARLQPTLDEINETAERQRARDVEIRAEAERAQEQRAKEKAREAEVKAEMRAAQDQEKLEARRKKEEEKQASREQATAEKEKRKAEAAAEKERLAKEKEEREAENRKSVEVKPKRFSSILRRKGKESTPTGTETTTVSSTGAPVLPELFTVAAPATPADGETVHDQVTVERTEQPKELDLTQSKSTEEKDAVPAPKPEVVSTPAPITTTTTTAATTTPSAGPTTTTALSSNPPSAIETTTSPTKRDSKVKSWFKTQFGGSSKTQKDEVESTPKVIGGEDVENTRDQSIRDVALAGKETDDLYGTNSREDRPVSPIREGDKRRSISSASSISSYSNNEAVIANARPLSGNEHTAQVGKPGLKAKLLKKIKSDKDEPEAITRTKSTDDEEEFEEAKDKFEDEKLTLPPSLSSAGRPSSPRASHEQSKFKEEL